MIRGKLLITGDKVGKGLAWLNALTAAMRGNSSF